MGRSSLAGLSKPVGTHALAAPLVLAQPAPLEATLRPAAHHVHAATAALSGRLALGARLGGGQDGQTAGLFPRAARGPKGRQAKCWPLGQREAT